LTFNPGYTILVIEMMEREMTNKTESLGFRLSRTIRKQDGDKERARLAMLEAQRVKKEAEERRVRVFLTSFKEELTKQIMGGHRPRGKKMPHNFMSNRNAPIYSTLHEHHFIFADFTDWLNDNDLQYQITNEHDGMGMDSWYEILVTPKEGIE